MHRRTEMEVGPRSRRSLRAPGGPPAPRPSMC